MLIGIGEALITALVLASIAKTRPELMRPESSLVAWRWGELAGYGLLVSLGIALFLSPFASKLPDGLESAALTLGFNQQAAEKPVLPALAADYKLRALVRRRSRHPSPAPSAP